MILHSINYDPLHPEFGATFIIQLVSNELRGHLGDETRYQREWPISMGSNNRDDSISMHFPPHFLPLTFARRIGAMSLQLPLVRHIRFPCSTAKCNPKEGRTDHRQLLVFTSLQILLQLKKENQTSVVTSPFPLFIVEHAHNPTRSRSLLLMMPDHSIFSHSQTQLCSAQLFLLSAH